jgi:hypothetical protein
MINKYKFSIFADLGDLSQYNLNELQKRVQDSVSFSSYKEGEKLIATFKDEQTTIIILYKLDGEFIKIFSETWASPASFFERKTMHT